jgi:flavin-dependent dehydrogenase
MSLPLHSKPVHKVIQDYDVAIVGGGLAGLTLAAQLHDNDPGLSIVVLERNSLPPPAATHKVGESTVEIGAHYLAETLGLREHLEKTQLHKFGLRLFFGSGGHGDLSQADELGASSVLPAKSYQVDRGRLEGDLATMLQGRGVAVLDGCVVRNAEISGNGASHRLDVTTADDAARIHCRWVVDASSRAAVIKRRMDMNRSCSHQVSSAWFRLDRRIAVDDWSSSADWQNRCDQPRFYSTNHLMGSGYWVWIIPLVDDRTSIGLVADPDVHPLSSYSNFEKLTRWLGEHQPMLAENIADAGNSLMDFKFCKNLAQDSDKVWSGQRWALTGEAGLFTDPFYSPGSDFIGISNTFVADLIRRDGLGESSLARSEIYERIYRSFFESTMSLYERQYLGFGDTRLMTVKTTWDYAYYWSILSWLYFRDVLTNLDFLRDIQPKLVEMRALNDTMQAAFRERATERIVSEGHGRFFDQKAIPLLFNLNAALLESPASRRQEFDENCERLTALVPILLTMLADESSNLSSDCSLTGDLASRLN